MVTKFKKTKPLILAILLFVAGFFTCFFFYSKFDSKESRSSLSARYPDGYITKTIRVGDLLVACSTDNTESEFIDVPQNLVPSIVYVLGKKVSNQSYEVNFRGLNFGNYNKNFRAVDVDNDGVEEILSEWIWYGGGSDGSIGLVIWRVDDEKGLIPFAGYPLDRGLETSDSSKLEIKNLKTGEILTYPTTSFNYLIEYPLDYPPFRLNYAAFIWDLSGNKPEAHFGPHFWKLSVFTFEKDRFVRDKFWNDGESYLTTKKIPVNEEGLMEIGYLFSSLSSKR